MNALVLTAILLAASADPTAGVGIDQNLGQKIDPSLTFRDETGKTVEIGSYLGHGPVILAPVYFDCPMLCTRTLNGLVEGLKNVDLDAGEDFTVLAVSFDPGETPALAAAKREGYLRAYGRAGAGAGWHFLTGDESSIRPLMDRIGFHYRYDEKKDQYAHAAGVMLLTKDGRLSRYLYGVRFLPRDLRFGLVDASGGEVGSPVDQVLLLCFAYDPSTGKYGFVVMNAIRLGGVLTLGILGLIVGVSLVRERRRKRRSVNA